MSKKIFVILLLVLFVNFGLLFTLNNHSAQAAGATLFLYPDKGAYNVGDTFTVKVMVDSGGGVGINASEVVVNFSKDYLMVSKINKTNSIFELWTTKPVFSNKDGVISFGGGVTSAYTGTAGTIISINFVALKSGTAEVSFASGVVTAYDGKGTNIFSGSSSGSYTLTVKEKVKEKKEPKKLKESKEQKVSKGALPPSPEVYLVTHPEEDKWYSNNKPEFGWKLLSDVTGVSLMLTDSSDSNPGHTSDGIIESKKYEEMEDGIYYFHIKFQNQYGWGPITHRKILVDTNPPDDFKLELDNEGDPTNPTPILKFFTEDATSGIKNYKVILNGEEEEVNPDDFKNNYFRLQKLLPGSYQTTVVAVDNADNTVSSSLNFVVEPLRPPVIIEIPKTIKKGDDLIIRGTSFYSDVTVEIFISKNGGENISFQVKTDEEGNWNYFNKENLEKGIFEIWAKIIDSRGAESMDSTKHILTIISPSIIASFGLYIIIVLIVIIIILVLIIFYLINKNKQNKKRILREILEVRKRSNEIFLALHDETNELMEYADKKAGVSESEKRVKDKLIEALDISEEFINKEIDDVEKEINLPH